MRTRLRLRNQLALSLLVALVSGYLFQPGGAGALAFPAAPTQVPASTPDQTPRPLVTLPGVWAVGLTLHRGAPPQVDTISYLERGRITALQPGDSSVRFLGAGGEVLYESMFQPVFMQGEPLRSVDTVQTILVLPAIEGARRLQVTTPQGEVSHELPAP